MLLWVVGRVYLVRLLLLFMCLDFVDLKLVWYLVVLFGLFWLFWIAWFVLGCDVFGCWVDGAGCFAW